MQIPYSVASKHVYLAINRVLSAALIWLEIYYGVRGSGSKFFTGKFPISSKNWPFIATSGQIILFLFNSHHFLTYLDMIRYNNNISQPVHDPYDPYNPLPTIWKLATPQPSQV